MVTKSGEVIPADLRVAAAVGEGDVGDPAMHLVADSGPTTPKSLNGQFVYGSASTKWDHSWLCLRRVVLHCKNHSKNWWILQMIRFVLNVAMLTPSDLHSSSLRL